MEPEEFKEAETFLKIEQMHADVVYAIAIRTAPKWADLSLSQKLWAKLTCLYNHIDNPGDRMTDVLNLFAQCAADPNSGAPSGRLHCLCLQAERNEPPCTPEGYQTTHSVPKQGKSLKPYWNSC